MKVSFLVTYYNQEQYVKSSMDSILALEKPFDWEILVGDDGSTDMTVEEIKKFIQHYPNHIKLIVMPREPNVAYQSVKRVSNSRLTLLEQATGDYFCVIDGDDFYCDTTFVKESLEIFKKHPDISVVSYGYSEYINGVYGKEVSLTKDDSGNIINTYDYIKNYYIHAGACVFKKAFKCDRLEMLKCIGYFDDNDILINNLCYGNIFAMKKNVYAYRQTGISVYTSMKCLEKGILNVQGYDVDCNIAPKFINELKHRNRKALIYTYIKRKKIKLLLGNKWSTYLEASQTIPNGLIVRLLNYDSLEIVQKRQLNFFMLKFMVRNLKTSLKIVLEVLEGE